MEDMIHEEVNLFKSLISQHNGEPIDLINKFNLPILNALWRITVGQRFEYEDPKLVKIVEMLTKMFQRYGGPENIIAICFPWVFSLFPKFLNRHESLKTIQDIMDLMMENVKHHQETLDPNEPRDFTDKMLIEIENTKDESSSFYGEKGLENLANNLFDLFLAGAESTANTLTWSALYMIRYPEVQKRVQDELDKVVGRSRQPCLNDRPNLPYSQVKVQNDNDK